MSYVLHLKPTNMWEPKWALFYAKIIYLQCTVHGIILGHH